MKARDAWWAFLTGRPESEWNPPKKPKKQKIKQDPRYDSYGQGMRSYTAEYEVQYAESATELSYMAEEGEGKNLDAVDPSHTLPTPFGTPAPPDTPDRTITGFPDGTSNDASSSTSGIAKFTQPEPTPSLLRNMDHVSTFQRVIARN